jgi:arsenical pump membrane protein
MLHLFFRRDIPVTYDLAKLKAPREAIRDARTFKAGWVVLVLLLVGFFALEPSACRSAWWRRWRRLFWLVARKGHVIDAGRVLKARPGRSLSFRWACIWWYTDCVTPD